MPLPPRLARMVVAGANEGVGQRAVGDATVPMLLAVAVAVVGAARGQSMARLLLGG